MEAFIQTPPAPSQAQKKKKKKNKAQKEANKHVHTEECHHNDHHEQQDHDSNLDQILEKTNNDILIHQILDAEPNFSQFDAASQRLKDKINELNSRIHKFEHDDFSDVQCESEEQAPVQKKNITDKKKKAISELQEKIDFFKDKINTLGNLKKLVDSEAISSEEESMIATINENLLDDIKRVEEFVHLIEIAENF